MVEIRMLERVGAFAEDKDTARDIMLDEILPALKNRMRVVLDFRGVDSATQSFMHALISGPIQELSIDVLDLLEFKNCNDQLKSIIGIVVEYMQTDTG